MYYKKFLYKSVFNSPFARPNLTFPANAKNCAPTDPLAEITSKMGSVLAEVLQKGGNAYRVVSQHVHRHNNKLKNHSTVIIRAWTRQCEYIVAQRFRRTQQMFCLYTRLWEEKALRELLRRMKQQLTRHSKEIMFGAIGISAFSWDTQKISDEELFVHVKEFDYVTLLTQKTIICTVCKQHRLVDIMLPDKTYCKCSGNANAYSHDNWVPFLERKNLLVWRRQRNGNYEYKLYGIYDDVTAEDFLQVQINTEFRQSWDTTAVNLYVVDSDTKSNSDIIYWEMLWPRMFSNRDYVYNRRYIIDRENNIITIISKSIDHPSCPLNPDKHRVRDYQSCMVIRPSRDFKNPGIEFSLTYYDDPGVNIPAAVASWVAVAGMPDFLHKLRLAAKRYREEKMVTGMKSQVGEERSGVVPPMKMPESEEIPQPTSATPEPETRSYWRYIHPNYYLG